MIEAITFQKFKQFRSERIPLRSKGVSLIAGGNNSGKSSILQGLAVWEFCRTVIEAEKGSDAFLKGGTAQGLGLGDDEFSPINVPSLRHLWTNLATQKGKDDPDGYTLRIKAEWKHDDSTKELEFGLALANDRLFVRATSSNLRHGDPIPQMAYLPPFAGITDREGRMPGAIRRRRIGEGLAGAVLRNLLLDLSTRNAEKRQQLRKPKIPAAELRKLREDDPWELLQQALRSRFSSEILIAPFSEEYHSYIRAEIVRGGFKGNRWTRHTGFKKRDLMVEGSGFLQWLSVFALAIAPGINTLLLDEPDAHLHCSLQQYMVEELEKLADKSGKQILIATHSTEILKNSDPMSIIELSRRGPRFLESEQQKIGLISGIGSEYMLRIDRLKTTKRLFLVEGTDDVRIIKEFAKSLNKAIEEKWVEWVSPYGHKERKHFFMALKEEIPDLIAVSLRDRDDEPRETVGESLSNKSHERGTKDIYFKKWRRRHIESYLLWPAAIAQVSGLPVTEVEDILRNEYGIAVGETFANVDAPESLLDIRGKVVLKRFHVDPIKVAEAMPNNFIPKDIIELLGELETLAQ